MDEFEKRIADIKSRIESLKKELGYEVVRKPTVTVTSPQISTPKTKIDEMDALRKKLQKK